MTTPIVDFVRQYAQSGTARLHMPGHKGQSLLGCEPWDITEIRGADELYEAEGIIAQSEANATRLFGTAHTYYSTEGSSQCIRAMLCLALQGAPRTGKRPVLLAARNAHKALLYAAALLDFDIRWLWPAPEDTGALCSCPVTVQALSAALEELAGQGRTPFGVYLTSPDYLGGMQDIFQSLRKGAALQDGQVKQLAEKALTAVHQPDIFHVLNIAGQYDEDLIVHSLHVGMLSGLLALWSKFDAERVKAALMAGLLHDIGKIRVPERILKKQDPLLPHELSVFKGYPFYSFQMLQGNDLPEKVLEGVLYHRERLDGSGYPLGLKADKLSQEIRIATICDVFEALTSTRPYKRAWTTRDALNWMFDRGHLFDKRLVLRLGGIFE